MWRRLKGNLTIVYKYLKCRCRGYRSGHYLVACRNRTSGNGHKSPEGQNSTSCFLHQKEEWSPVFQAIPVTIHLKTQPLLSFYHTSPIKTRAFKSMCPLPQEHRREYITFNSALEVYFPEWPLLYYCFNIFAYLRITLYKILKSRKNKAKIQESSE